MRSPIRLSVLFNILALAASILSISGCDKISGIVSEVSPEGRFLASLNARWSNANNANVIIDEIDRKIAVIDANGEMYVLVPTGKFDTDKKIMPVKMTIVPKLEGTQDVVAETLVRYVPASAESQKDCAGTGAPDLSATFNFKNVFSSTHVACMRKFAISEGMAALRQKIAAAVPELKAENIMQNLILYNASTDPNSFKLGLKRETGDIIWNFGFVRRLNDDEVKQLAALANNPQQITVERNAVIDKTVADILSYIEKQTVK